MTFWNILLIASMAANCVLSARLLIHYFQLESYQFQGYFRALKRSWKRLVRNGLALAVPLIPLALMCGLISGSAGRFLNGVFKMHAKPVSTPEQFTESVYVARS